MLSNAYRTLRPTRTPRRPVASFVHPGDDRRRCAATEASVPTGDRRSAVAAAVTQLDEPVAEPHESGDRIVGATRCSRAMATWLASAVVLVLVLGGCSRSRTSPPPAEEPVGQVEAPLRNVRQPAADQAPFAPGRVLVRFTEDVDAQAVVAAAGSGRMTLGDALMPALHIHLVHLGGGLDVPQAIGLLRNTPGVRWAQADHLIRPRATFPNDPEFFRQWGLHNTGQNFSKTPADGSCAGACGGSSSNCWCDAACAGYGDCCYDACALCGHCAATPDVDIDAPEAWDAGTGDGSANGPVVAIIDGGCDLTHPDLSPNLWTNPGEIPGNKQDDDGNGYVDDIHGWNAYTDKGSLPVEVHGTEVAGVAAARGNNGIGVAGVGWQTRFMFVAGSTGTTSVAVKAFNYILTQKQLWISTGGTQGANVVALNMSFGV